MPQKGHLLAVITSGWVCKACQCHCHLDWLVCSYTWLLSSWHLEQVSASALSPQSSLLRYQFFWMALMRHGSWFFIVCRHHRGICSCSLGWKRHADIQSLHACFSWFTSDHECPTGQNQRCNWIGFGGCHQHVNTHRLLSVVWHSITWNSRVDWWALLRCIKKHFRSIGGFSFLHVFPTAASLLTGLSVFVILSLSKMALQEMTFPMQLGIYMAVSVICLVAMLWVLWKKERSTLDVLRALKESSTASKTDWYPFSCMTPAHNTIIKNHFSGLLDNFQRLP